MQKSDRIRLRHMLDSAREAESFTRGEKRASLDKDRKLVLSLVKSVEIIGEAAANISKESRKSLPEIPWENIIGMRNRLIHGYFEVDLDVLWQTIKEDLPPLIVSLEAVVPPERE